MPQVLTMTQKPGESNEAFADRIAGQVQSFFKGGNTDGTPVEQPDIDETSPPATDVSADADAPEEAAPSS